MPRALITGCSSGIGRATAQELTKRGYDVIATARRPETLEGLDVAETLRLDVNDDGSVSETVAAAGDVDVLVNNAGVGMHAPIERAPIDEVRKLFETNVFGALRMIQAVAPGMRERGSGAIVNVSSVAGRVSSPLGGIYAATKYALEAISESTHYELGHFGVRTIVIEPGGIETRFGDNRRIFGCDSPPWDELDRVWEAAQGRLREGESPGPELVAQTIAEALESDETQLRYPVGDDAHMVIAVRDEQSFEGFEATMRETLDLTW